VTATSDVPTKVVAELKLYPSRHVGQVWRFTTPSRFGSVAMENEGVVFSIPIRCHHRHPSISAALACLMKRLTALNGSTPEAP
jgi:hypothetical protein